MGAVAYLVDTHTFLWAVQKDVKLSNPAKKAMNDPNTQKFISAVSAYEVMYKQQLGKLHEYDEVANNYFSFMKKLGVTELPINSKHTHFAGKLVWAHRDPFDRLLAAQAFTENMVLITNDSIFDTLSWVSVLW